MHFQHIPTLHTRNQMSNWIFTVCVTGFRQGKYVAVQERMKLQTDAETDTKIKDNNFFFTAEQRTICLKFRRILHSADKTRALSLQSLFSACIDFT